MNILAPAQPRAAQLVAEVARWCLASLVLCALGASMIATCETLALAQKLGLDPQKFFDIASVSSGQCWSLTSYAPLPGVGPTTPADNGYKGGFAAALMLKDLRLAMEAAASVDDLKKVFVWNGQGGALPLGHVGAEPGRG